MGLFPKPLTTAAIWEYAARTLTNLPDARAARIDNMDVLLSTFRATEFGRIDAPISGVATPATVWAYATRSLTDKAGFAPTLSEIWAYVTRILTGYQVVTNRVSVPASGTLNVQPSAGKAGLVMFGSPMSEVTYRYYDGTNTDIVYTYLTAVGGLCSPCIVVCNSRYAQAYNSGAAARYVSYVELAWQVS